MKFFILHTSICSICATATALPASSVVVGDTYKVITQVTVPKTNSYTGADVVAKIGDLVVAMSKDPKWIVVPSGDEIVTTVKYSTTTQNLTTNAQSGAITVGEAATKQVDTSITSGTTSTKLPTSKAVADYVTWGNVAGKPSTFTPSAHTHTIANVTGLQSALDGKASSGHTHSSFSGEIHFSVGGYKDPANGISTAIKASGGIAADVFYEGTTKLSDKYQPKGSYAAASHTHTIAQITNLQSTLDSKSNNGHTHDDRYYTESEMDVIENTGTAYYTKLFELTADSTYINYNYEFAIAERNGGIAYVHIYLYSDNNKYFTDALIRYKTDSGYADFITGNMKGFVYKDTTKQYSKLEVWFKVDAWQDVRIMEKTVSDRGCKFTWASNFTRNAAFPTDATSIVEPKPQTVAWGNITGKPSTYYTHPSYTARSSGLYKVTVDATGHVSGATAVSKADITALGIPGTDTNTWRGVQNNLTSTATDQSLSAAQGKILNETKTTRHDWNTIIKCATWSRLCCRASCCRFGHCSQSRMGKTS